MSSKTQPKSEIHVFEIAEKAFVEPAYFRENVASIERGRRARRKDLIIVSSALDFPTAVIAAPRETAYMIDVAGSIKAKGILCLKQLTAKKLDLRSGAGRTDEAFEPVGLCKGVRIQARNPCAIACARDPDVVCLRKTMISIAAYHLGHRVRSCDSISGAICARIVHDNNPARPHGLRMQA